MPISESRVRSLENAATAAEGRLTTAAGEIATLREDVRKHLVEITDLKGKVERLEADVKDLKSKWEKEVEGERKDYKSLKLAAMIAVGVTIPTLVTVSVILYLLGIKK